MINHKSAKLCIVFLLDGENLLLIRNGPTDPKRGISPKPPISGSVLAQTKLPKCFSRVLYISSFRYSLTLISLVSLIPDISNNKTSESHCEGLSHN